MTATKYFIDAFGQSGDLTPIPDATQPSGSVSYNQGFPVNYQLPQTDPSSLDIPRTQTNQLFNDITLNLQQYQQVGAPNFITTSQNGGSPFAYNAYSIVTYDDGINGARTFMSKINSNTNLPTDTSAWLWLNNTSGSVVFDNATFDVSVSQGDAVYFDGTSLTFKQAIANGSIAQNVIGFADINFKRVFYSGDVNFLTGLTAGQQYYLSSVTPGQITNAVSGYQTAIQVGFAKSTSELFVGISLVTNKTIQYSLPTICQDVGTINNISAAIMPSISSYYTGLTIDVIIANMNTGTTFANINALGSVPVLSMNGNQLNPGDLMPGMVAKLVFESTAFKLSNPCKNSIGFRAQLTSNQTIPSATITKILFNNLISDINSNYDVINSRFVCQIPGHYFFKASCEAAGVTTASAGVTAYIYKNSVSISQNTISISDTTPNDEALFSNPSYFGALNVGDIVEVYVNLANTISPISADVATYFEAFRVY